MTFKHNFEMFLFFTFVSFFLVSCSQISFLSMGIPDSPQNIPTGSVKVSPPETLEWKLNNGLKVVYYQRAGIPITSSTLYIPKGSLSDDSGITGLSSVMVQQMREGGTRLMKPDVLDEFLDQKAASIEGSQDAEVTTFSFTGLSEDFDDLLKVFSQVVLEPSFDSGRLSLWKRLSEEEIKRRKDNPDLIASLAYQRLVYGELSPYSRLLTPESISQVTEKSLRAMHKRLIQPSDAVLIIVTDINSDFVKLAVEERFNSWTQFHIPGGGLDRFHGLDKGLLAPVPEAPGVYVVEANFEQASIITGHLGPKLSEVELYQQSLFNRALGSSGFGSLLFREVRDRRGLAYSVYGGFSNSITDGSFRVIAGTKVDRATAALTTIWEILNGIKKEPLSDDLVEPARQAISKSFVFKYEDPSYAAKRPTMLSIYGYPIDYDQVFVSKIEKVTTGDLQSFAKEHLIPDKLISVIVGQVRAEDVKNDLINYKTSDNTPVRVCRVIFKDYPVLGDCL
ncbi:MAG TPA: pitrilysin family protein [Oligoflexia bacterium]|nr:pitrilysin family protein [Oligoflexia bacterium]HMP48417.1 pitrilysin family protein [Oligoflexia bacterium]